MAMADRYLSNPGARFLLTAASLMVVVAGLRAAAELLRPLVLALFLAIISLPVLRWLQRLGAPRSLAVALTLLVDIAVLLLVIALVGGSVTAFTAELPKYQERLTQMTQPAVTWLEDHGFPLDRETLGDVFNPGAMMDVVGATLKGAAGVVSKTFLVLLTLAFVLSEATGFGSKLRAAFSLTDTHRFSGALRQVQHYLAIKTLISLVTGFLVWIWLALWGIDFAMLWGVVAFLLNYIPSLGSILAALPVVLLAAIQKGLGTALIVAAAYLAINIVLGNFLEPTLMGRKMGLSTLVVFLSLLFWGWVWGPIGMLLSVPLTMALKILLESTKDFRWLAVMLGPPVSDALPASPAPSPESAKAA